MSPYTHRMRLLVLQVLVLVSVLTQTDCGHYDPGGQSQTCYVPDTTVKLPLQRGITRRPSNCSNPASRVCFDWMKRPTGFKVLIRACPNVRALRVQLTRWSYFQGTPVNSRVESCNRKNDLVLIQRPKRQQTLVVASDSNHNTTNPGLMWSSKDPSRWNSGTRWRKGHECGQRQRLRERRSNPDKVEAAKFAVNDMKACGTVQSCVRFGPKDCHHLECDYLLTYRIINHTVLHLEISGKSDGWVALGLSSDNKMGGDDVIACKRKTVMTSDLEALSMAMNVPYSRPRDHRVNDLVLEQSRMEGNYIYCKMTRTLANHVVASDSKVDLTNNWYQFYAKGEIDRHGVMLKHRETPPTSLETITMLRPFKTDSIKYQQQTNHAPSISTPSLTMMTVGCASIVTFFTIKGA